MKKKKLIFPAVLCLLLLYRGLNQIGIRIESPQVLVIVMCGLCVLTFYDFIVKFKIWLNYIEERENIKNDKTCKAETVMNAYEKFCKLGIDRFAIGLGKSEYDVEYFCTPVGANVIGYEGIDGIHYCFISGFDDIVFAVNPMSVVDHYVYPLAKNFEDFLSLIISCNSTAAVEQIIGWDNKEIFEKYIQPSEDEYYLARKTIFQNMKVALNIDVIDDPFEYVKNIQEDFPYEKIPFRDEYYECTGRERSE